MEGGGGGGRGRGKRGGGEGVEKEGGGGGVYSREDGAGGEAGGCRQRLRPSRFWRCKMKRKICLKLLPCRVVSRSPFPC